MKEYRASQILIIGMCAVWSALAWVCVGFDTLLNKGFVLFPMAVGAILISLIEYEKRVV